MTDVIRWGILGTGKIAHALATALAQVPDAKLVAVASRSQAGADAFGRQFGAARCHATYQALADDAQVDVIYIATPHPMHAENALMALRAGKHVLCEKAFTMNRREAAEVVAVARQTKRFLMEAMWTRFLPAVVEAKRLIAAGAIGTVRQMQADLGFVAKAGAEHRLRNPDLGGGALLDIGIYPLSMAAFFLGPVLSVQAQADIGPTGVDEQTVFTLQHQNGALSAGACSLRAHTQNELTICGDGGYLRLHSRFHQASRLTIEPLGGESRTIELPFIGNGYPHQVMEVMRCLRAGLTESPIMPLDESVELMSILDTMRGQIGLAYRADLAPA
ncbi:MAG: Gfo/Idh/MocA family oxidoreductase [Pseudomonadota bacterium]